MRSAIRKCLRSLSMMKKRTASTNDPSTMQKIAIRQRSRVIIDQLPGVLLLCHAQDSIEVSQIFAIVKYENSQLFCRKQGLTASANATHKL